MIMFIAVVSASSALVVFRIVRGAVRTWTDLHDFHTGLYEAEWAERPAIVGGPDQPDETETAAYRRLTGKVA